jgi:hypothetical protein
MFLYPARSAGHIVPSGASGAQSVHVLIFMLGWDWYGYKNCVGTRYAKLVFLHLVGFIGHVVHFGTFGALNIDTLFFMPGWP